MPMRQGSGAGVPLTYTLTMKACLSHKYTERPSFAQVLQLLHDVQGEVAAGRYMDGTGRVQVRASVLPRLVHALAAACQPARWQGMAFQMCCTSLRARCTAVLCDGAPECVVLPLLWQAAWV